MAVRLRCAAGEAPLCAADLKKVYALMTADISEFISLVGRCRLTPC